MYRRDGWDETHDRWPSHLQTRQFTKSSTRRRQSTKSFTGKRQFTNSSTGKYKVIHRQETVYKVILGKRQSTKWFTDETVYNVVLKQKTADTVICRRDKSQRLPQTRRFTKSSTDKRQLTQSFTAVTSDNVIHRQETVDTVIYTSDNVVHRRNRLHIHLQMRQLTKSSTNQSTNKVFTNETVDTFIHGWYLWQTDSYINSYSLIWGDPEGIFLDHSDVGGQTHHHGHCDFTDLFQLPCTWNTSV